MTNGNIFTIEDKEKIKRAISKSNNKIIESTVAKLYIAYPNPQKWNYTGLFGAIVLVEDLVGHTFFLKLVDLVGTNNVIWDQETYCNFNYNQDRKFFHTFETEECLAGLLFLNAGEASKFYKKVIKRYKFGSKKTLNNTNQIPINKKHDFDKYFSSELYNLSFEDKKNFNGHENENQTSKTLASVDEVSYSDSYYQKPIIINKNRLSDNNSEDYNSLPIKLKTKPPPPIPLSKTNRPFLPKPTVPRLPIKPKNNINLGIEKKKVIESDEKNEAYIDNDPKKNPQDFINYSKMTSKKKAITPPLPSKNTVNHTLVNKLGFSDKDYNKKQNDNKTSFSTSENLNKLKSPQKKNIVDSIADSSVISKSSSIFNTKKKDSNLKNVPSKPQINNLLDSIRKCDGINHLKKTSKNNLQKNTKKNISNVDDIDSSSPVNLSNALKLALDKRKNKVSKSDDDE